MKKFLYFATGASLLAMASCSQDSPELPGGDGMTTFTVTLADAPETRAFSDGTGATKLSYVVYEKDVTDAVIDKWENSGVTFEGKTATVNIKLVNGVSYDIVFFASNAEADYYTFDAASKTLTVNYDGATVNDDRRDAFFGSFSTGVVNGAIEADVTLKRPFAQINLGTDDYDDVKTKYTDGVYTKVMAKGVADKLNLLDGTVSGNEDLTVTFEKGAASDETFPVEAGTGKPAYKYLAMNYILVPEERSVVDITAEFHAAANSTTPRHTIQVPSAPVQRNFRTNVYGSLLTSNGNFNVNIDATWNELWNGTDEELAELIAKGGNIKIDKEVDIIDLSNATQPVNLILAKKVNSLILGDFQQPVSVKVEKDVDFPTKMKANGRLNNFTLIGDIETSKPCHQLKLYELGTNIGSLTITNVKFDGNTLPTNNGSAIVDDRYVTENLLVDGCVFENLKFPAVGINKGNTNENITIKNCNISYADDADSNTNGLYLLCTKNVKAVGNTITNAPYNGIFVQAYASAYIADNRIVNAKKDGIKVETEGPNSNTGINESVTVINNIIKGHVNGIRVCKGHSNLSKKVTIYGNTIDMSEVTEAWDETAKEPSAILLHTKASTFNPLINVYDNILTNDFVHKFSIHGFTPAEGSVYQNPFK